MDFISPKISLDKSWKFTPQVLILIILGIFVILIFSVSIWYSLKTISSVVTPPVIAQTLPEISPNEQTPPPPSRQDPSEITQQSYAEGMIKEIDLENNIIVMEGAFVPGEEVHTWQVVVTPETRIIEREFVPPEVSGEDEPQIKDKVYELSDLKERMIISVMCIEGFKGNEKVTAKNIEIRKREVSGENPYIGWAYQKPPVREEIIEVEKFELKNTSLKQGEKIEGTYKIRNKGSVTILGLRSYFLLETSVKDEERAPFVFLNKSEDMFFLRPNEAREKPFVLDLPSDLLNGEYKFDFNVLDIGTSIRASQGETLNIEGDDQLILLDQAKFYREGEELDVVSGWRFEPGTSPELHLRARKLLKGPLEVIPEINIYKVLVFPGEEIQSHKEDLLELTKEKEFLSFSLPGLTHPQPYDATIQFWTKDGKPVSNLLRVHWIVGEEYGRIMGLNTDVPEILEDNEVGIKVSYVARFEEGAPSRPGELFAQLLDSNKQTIGEVEKEVDFKNRTEALSIPISLKNQASSLLVRLSIDGEMLDEVRVPFPAFEYPSINIIKVLLVIIIILALIIFAFWFISKKVKSPKTKTTLLLLLLGIGLVCLIFIPYFITKADYSGCCEDWWGIGGACDFHCPIGVDYRWHDGIWDGCDYWFHWQDPDPWPIWTAHPGDSMHVVGYINQPNCSNSFPWSWGAYDWPGKGSLVSGDLNNSWNKSTWDWSVNVPDVGDGTYRTNVRWFGELGGSVVAGHVGVWDEIKMGENVKVDNRPPNVSVVSPASGQWVNSGNVLFQANASDPDPAHGVDRVEFWHWSPDYCMCTDWTNTYTCNINVTSGMWWEARAYDKHGEWGKSGWQELKVCDHECSPSGATRCSGTWRQICATDGDTDPCREWKNDVNCHSNYFCVGDQLRKNRCSGGSCGSNFIDNCTDDYYYCSGDNIMYHDEFCVNGQSSCSSNNSFQSTCTDIIGGKYCSGSGTNTKVVHDVTDKYCQNPTSWNNCKTGSTNTITDATCSSSYSCDNSTTIRRTCTAVSGITCSDSWVHATCSGWGAWGPWSCHDLDTRKKSRDGSFCQAPLSTCQPQTETQYEDCPLEKPHCVGGICIAICTDEAPDSPSLISPSPSGVTGVDINADLDWSWGSWGTNCAGDDKKYSLWFGTDPTPDAGELRINNQPTGVSIYDPGSLNYDTTYYWQVEQCNFGCATGPVWSFTIGSAPNNPPSATLDAPFMSVPCPPSSVTVSFSWTYNDADGDPESRFDFRVNDVNNVNDPNPEVDRTFSGLNNPDGTANSQLVEVVASPQNDKILFNQTYHWWTRVWDEPGDNSGWVYGGSIDTPTNPPPDPSFECSLGPSFDWTSDCNSLGAITNETVHFRNTNTGYDYYGWDFDYNDAFTENATGSGVPPDPEVSHAFSAAGTYEVMHRVIDDGLTCDGSQTLDIYGQLPEWREIPPT